MVMTGVSGRVWKCDEEERPCGGDEGHCEVVKGGGVTRKKGGGKEGEKTGHVSIIKSPLRRQEGSRWGSGEGRMGDRWKEW